MNEKKIIDAFTAGISADYRQTRLAAYPEVGEQLDMLWHAMDHGDLDKVEPFYTTIKNVKLDHPPTTVITGTYWALIKNGYVSGIIKCDKEEIFDFPLDGIDGAVEITQETIDYVGFMPCIGDQFITTGGQYSVPPGTFISSNS